MQSQSASAVASNPPVWLPEDYFDNSAFSDVSIVFGGVSVRAHKIILATRSGYFSTAFRSSFSIATNPVVNLDDDEPDLVHAMLRHIYGLPYDKYLRPSADQLLKSDHLDFELEMYLLADKYDVPSLRKLISTTIVDHFYEQISKPSMVPFLKKLFGSCHADRSLQQQVFSGIRLVIPDMIKNNKVFAEELKKGQIFDTEWAGALIFDLGRMSKPSKEVNYVDQLFDDSDPDIL